jgi:2-C-methyl-D-erythritol 4-phosphate cytidylyltransferase
LKQFVILVAGGTGTRMHQPVAKQFIELKGLPLMWWTLRRFREALGEDLDVTLVLFPGLFDQFEALEKKYGPAGINRIVEGGEERWHSVANGLQALPEEGLVAVHDAVRPFVSVETISRCFEVAEQHGSAIPTVPLKDSVRQVKGAGSKALDRSSLRAIQTPQCFDLQTLKLAYARGFQEEFTDDSSVYESAGYRIELFDGDLKNIKVTTPEDLLVAEAFLEKEN